MTTVYFPLSSFSHQMKSGTLITDQNTLRQNTAAAAAKSPALTGLASPARDPQPGLSRDPVGVQGGDLGA